MRLILNNIIPILVIFFIILKANAFERNGYLKKIINQENYTDTLYKPYYPEGIYYSKEDFVKKKPINSKDIELRNHKKDSSKEILDRGFFFNIKTNKLLKNVFAVSYKGHLYFQLKAILKHRNKNDRAQTTPHYYRFVRVVLGGNNFLYTEAELANKWAKQSLAQLGVIGYSKSKELTNEKGIVWDFKNEEFNIFKSCKDYNDFIKRISENDVQKCMNHQPDIILVRKTISKIK